MEFRFAPSRTHRNRYKAEFLSAMAKPDFRERLAACMDRHSKYFISTEGSEYEKCTKAGTRTDASGRSRYPKFDVSREFPGCGQIYVHILYFIWKNPGETLRADMDISHCDEDPAVCNFCQESREWNEGRNLCHLYKLYRNDPIFGRPLCPHIHHPCTGRG